MSKKNKIYLILLVVLAAVAVWLIKSRSTSTLDSADSQFAVEDTAAVTKVFIANRAGGKLLLEKQADKIWKVNGKYRVRKDMIEMVMSTIHRIKVKSPLPVGAVENAMKNFATSSTKVEVYAGDEVVKAFYIGGTTQDELGTYFLMEGSEVPYIVEIPGFFGFLTTRFTTKEEDWRDRAVFRYTPGTIDNIEVNYTNDPASSFKIKIVSDKMAQVTSGKGDTATGNINGDFFRQYVAYYNEIHYEKISKIRESAKDSVIKNGPFCKLLVIDKFGKRNEVPLFLMPLKIFGITKYADSPTPLEFDNERCFALVNNGTEFVQVQYFVFDKLLVKYPDFFKKDDSKIKN